MGGSPSEGFLPRGICIWGIKDLHSWGRGDLYPGGGLDRPPPGTRKAGGTHPTGILSCFLSALYEIIKNRLIESRCVGKNRSNGYITSYTTLLTKSH